MVNELQARLHSLYNGRTPLREVGPQTAGLERYRLVVTGDELYTLLEAADRISELEAKLQMTEGAFTRIRELEAAIHACLAAYKAEEPSAYAMLEACVRHTRNLSTGSALSDATEDREGKS
jgi:hypothetical protein